SLVRSQAAAPEGVRLKFIDADVAALREADGAVVVIDIVEGCYAAIVTCGELRQCLSQARSIKPVLVLTKLDRAFLELQLVNDDEEIYSSMCRCIESVNRFIIDLHRGEAWLSLTRALSPLPRAYTAVMTFATLLGQKFGVAPAILQKRLWGDNFYDADVKRRKTNISPTTGKRLDRGFCYFVLSPIRFILTACLGGPEQREALDKALLKLGIELQPEEKALQGKDLMKCVMPKFLPLGTAQHPSCPPCTAWFLLS
ncbi:translation elongation factor 2, putative, partial [Acanthamoeba castellanii str. Neff]